MRARDIMTTEVISVGPDVPTRMVARLLGTHGISAVPVVDATGAPIGMVSEGDLIGRNDSDRRERRDWWLALLAEGEELHPDFLATFRESELPVRNVMSGPVITVSETADIKEVARLLVSHRIKRVPVVRDGRVVGIISRADLVRAMASEEAVQAAPPRHGGLFANALNGIDEEFHHLRERQRRAGALSEPALTPADHTRLTVGDFRTLVADHKRKETAQRSAHQQGSDVKRRQRIAELIEQHITDRGWRQLLHQAREAAERGEQEFMLLRFPSTLCRDSGRAINGAEPGWPLTLCGEAAELYLRWERDLKPQGFPITARVLDFPGGMPGDVGLFLDWAI
jgi:CBS domain-containing protein